MDEHDRNAMQPGKKMPQHHFLFHIFRLDKAEHPMSPQRSTPLLHKLLRVFKESGRA
ncbi:MAG: hypothetical protein IIY16_01505 [Oscillospiraceae bacterium]|nr:hypothetical protein [Oscillospiraceae bacterium]